jgi:hypothetical protein
MNTTSKKQGCFHNPVKHRSRINGTRNRVHPRSNVSEYATQRIASSKSTSNSIYQQYGAIFLVKNHKVGSRTKHIAVQHLYLREMQEKGDVNVEFIPAAQNLRDIGTKPLVEKLSLNTPAKCSAADCSNI